MKSLVVTMMAILLVFGSTLILAVTEKNQTLLGLLLKCVPLSERPACRSGLLRI